MFKKKPDELNVKEALVYTGLIGILCFMPFLIIDRYDSIKDWCGARIDGIKSLFGKGAD